jgi:ABC-2 type transport system permease protein
MTATIVPPATTTEAAPVRRTARPIPTTRLVKVELRKMFNTRSGFWMLISIGVLSVIATGAVIIFAPDSAVTYANFASAIGLPMSVILPMIAILAVTSEWSQRSGLTTFTLVPSRGRVIGAKAIATLLVGLGSMAVAFAVGALGNVAGSALAGVDTVWDISLSMAPQMVLGDLVGMAIGFTLGVVLRNSAAAIVGYFVVSFVMPGVLVLLAQVRSWFEDLQPWIDWNKTQVVLFDGATNTGKEWAMLGSTTMIWIVIPLVVGLLSLRRSEVKKSRTRAALPGTHLCVPDTAVSWWIGSAPRS